MGDLTEPMKRGLHEMAIKLRRRSDTMAEPNDNTGKALERRGLVVFTERRNGWNYYRLTTAGRAALSEITGEPWLMPDDVAAGGDA